MCSLGLIGLAILPDAMGGLIGILVSTVIYGVGGGLLEVLVSPVLESIPSGNKSGTMSLLHSFYCWGSAFTVVISTLFFVLFGVENWRILSLLFAVMPLVNAFFFTRVPITSPEPTKKSSAAQYKELLTNKRFLLFLMMMLCAGAAEMAVQQWSSAFAETALSVSKTLGDLFGMCGFSVTMALARTLYGKFSDKIALVPTLFLSSVLCVICYLLISFSSSPVLGFVGCILCGFSVGIFWPGSFSIAAKEMPKQTTLMFALLSLAGDVGCTVGPTIAGFVCNAAGGDLRIGILSAIVFPIILPLCLFILIRSDKKNESIKM
jgi:fucose permease